MTARMNGDPLIEELLTAARFPHAVDAPVHCVETHISWVLLTGPYAYKIKKPLKLGFLDYSEPAARRRFCEEELRLNRRYAPDLYLDVVGIARRPGELEVGVPLAGADEFAVRMRQFDRSQELDALVEADAVLPDELAALGELVGRFHSQAVPADPRSEFGRPALVHRITRDNFSEIAASPAASAWQGPLDRLELAVNVGLERLGPMMAQRREAGWTRECHGDMHCANIVRWEGRLMPFDGIEFDPALRFIDVVNDIAFLTMDLGVRGRRDLRRAALGAWAETLGDFPGLALLGYYETYRALVRAKVASLRARQHIGGSPQHAAALGKSRLYLQWAADRTQHPAPRLYLTCGLSGSGKTWLARALAPGLDALHLRSDVERKRLAGLEPLADSRSLPGGGLYTREFNARTYERLRNCARGCLRGGENVIVDAAFLRAGERIAMLALAREFAAPVRILHCTAPMGVLRERVSSRQARRTDASEAGVEVLRQQPHWWEDFTAEERPFVLEVDSTRADAVGGLLSSLSG